MDSPLRDRLQGYTLAFHGRRFGRSNRLSPVQMLPRCTSLAFSAERHDLIADFFPLSLALVWGASDEICSYHVLAP
jgi:hypothetical protein